MTPAELETWLWNARERARNAHALPENWWPNTTTKGDKTSAWALAYFLEGAETRCFGKVLHLSAHLTDATTPVIASWKSPPAREHSPHEVLLDYSIHHWRAASPIQMTCESEAWPFHTTGAQMEKTDDYSWDFYKLLVVPSATRLFFARVGGKTKDPDNGSATERIGRLLESLQSLVDLYGPALLRPNDELGGAIIPYSPKAVKESLVFWLDRGRLRSRQVALPPDLTGAPEAEPEPAK